MRVKDDCEDLKQLGDLKTPGTKADIDEAQALHAIPEHMNKYGRTAAPAWRWCDGPAY